MILYNLLIRRSNTYYGLKKCYIKCTRQMMLQIMVLYFMYVHVSDRCDHDLQGTAPNITRYNQNNREQCATDEKTRNNTCTGNSTCVDPANTDEQVTNDESISGTKMNTIDEEYDDVQSGKDRVMGHKRTDETVQSLTMEQRCRKMFKKTDKQLQEPPAPNLNAQLLPKVEKKACSNGRMRISKSVRYIMDGNFKRPTAPAPRNGTKQGIINEMDEMYKRPTTPAPRNGT